MVFRHPQPRVHHSLHLNKVLALESFKSLLYALILQSHGKYNFLAIFYYNIAIGFGLLYYFGFSCVLFTFQTQN